MKEKTNNTGCTGKKRSDVEVRDAFKIRARPKLNSPVMMAAWPGIGNVSIILASYLRKKLEFKELIQPAIDLAEKGFAISAAEAGALNANRGNFENTLETGSIRMPITSSCSWSVT